MTTGPQVPAVSRDRLRAGHADREQAIEALKTAFVDGRLTKSELAARAGRALAARTYADLTALTADIPVERAAAEPAAAVPAPAVQISAEPAAAAPGPSCPPDPAIRRPLAKAAGISGACLAIATAFILISVHLTEGGSGPSPYHSLVKSLLLLALVAVMTALLAVGLGVATSIKQRRPRRQLPPRSGSGGQASTANGTTAPPWTSRRGPRDASPRGRGDEG